VTFTFEDIREVWRKVGEEIQAICSRAGNMAVRFDVPKAIVEVNILAMNNVIDAVGLDIFVEDELLYRYQYRIITGAIQAFGPSAQNPPVGSLPIGARVRLTVAHNENVPETTRREWLDRLGWSPSKPLKVPDGATTECTETLRPVPTV
jgi:hypothetical protein